MYTRPSVADLRNHPPGARARSEQWIVQKAVHCRVKSFPASGFRRQLLYVAVLTACLAAGCAPFQKKVVADLSRNTPHDILAAVARNRTQVHSLKGRGRIIIESPQANFSGQARFFVKGPDSLFIIAKAALGVEVGFFFADRSRFSSYSPIDNVYYFGPVQDIDKLVLFQMKISYEDILNTVLGTPSFPASPEMAIRIEENQYIIEQPWQGMQLHYEVDPARYVITTLTLRDARGRLEAKQTFSRFKRRGNAWMPQLIRLFRPETREQLTIFYEGLTLNEPIDAAAFSYKVPENARRIDLETRH